MHVPHDPADPDHEDVCRDDDMMTTTDFTGKDLNGRKIYGSMHVYLDTDDCL